MPGVERSVEAGPTAHHTLQEEVVLSGELLRAVPSAEGERPDPWQRARRLEEHPGYQRNRFASRPAVRQALASYRELETLGEGRAAPRQGSRHDFYV